MLTAKQRETFYLKKGGCDCLHCGSTSIGQGFFESREGGGCCTMSCDECNAIWSDLYTLTGTREIIAGDQKNDSVQDTLPSKE